MDISRTGIGKSNSYGPKDVELLTTEARVLIKWYYGKDPEERFTLYKSQYAGLSEKINLFLSNNKDEIRIMTAGFIAGIVTGSNTSLRKNLTKLCAIKEYLLSLKNSDKKDNPNLPSVKECIALFDSFSFDNYLIAEFKRDEMEMVYSKYHTNRLDCVVFKTNENLFQSPFIINDILQWNSLINLIDTKNNNRLIPAGDWYFLCEQRTFLCNQLQVIFELFEDNDTVTIGEIFTPSYIHHFTYVAVIIQALKKSQKKLKIQISIVDQYLFPLVQVARIHKLIVTNEAFNPIFFPSIQMPNFPVFPEFAVKKDFADFVNNEFDRDFYRRYFAEPEYERYNISDSIPKKLHNKFDVITEHFLMKQNDSMRTYDWVGTVKENYKLMAKREMYLIGAIANCMYEGFDYFKLMSSKGFQILSKESVWDIFCENVSTLKSYKVGDEVNLQSYLFSCLYQK